MAGLNRIQSCFSKSLITKPTFESSFSFMHWYHMSIQVSFLWVGIITHFTFERFLSYMNCYNMPIHVSLEAKSLATKFTFECFFSFMDWIFIFFRSLFWEQLQGVHAIRGFVICRFAICRFSKPWKFPHFETNPLFAIVEKAENGLFHYQTR